MSVPKHHELMQPVLKAISELGGSASNEEIMDKIASDLKLSDEDLSLIHQGNESKLQYRLAWAKSYLKAYGLIENSQRGIWSVTQKGRETKQIDTRAILKFVRERPQNEKKKTKKSGAVEIDAGSLLWQEEILDVIRKIKPDAFERLCQRVLRESGFVEVTVTGSTGDGGIDGHGVIRMGGLIGFPVVFQFKRYKGSVSPSQVRDFRGAMAGRADKGLVITTGTFTSEAKAEAKRPGAQPIDLIDGWQLAEHLKNLKLGVVAEHVEKVRIDSDWFAKEFSMAN